MYHLTLLWIAITVAAYVAGRRHQLARDVAAERRLLARLPPEE